MLGQTQRSAIVALSIESNQKMDSVISRLKPKINIIQDSIKD